MADATVTGPVVGGSHGWAFSASVRDLDEVGYVEDEWFVEGEATTYDFAPGADAADDGRWDTVAVGSVPYRTRFLALRPADPGPRQRHPDRELEQRLGGVGPHRPGRPGVLRRRIRHARGDHPGGRRARLHERADGAPGLGRGAVRLVVHPDRRRVVRHLRRRGAARAFRRAARGRRAAGLRRRARRGDGRLAVGGAAPLVPQRCGAP